MEVDGAWKDGVGERVFDAALRVDAGPKPKVCGLESRAGLAAVATYLKM